METENQTVNRQQLGRTLYFAWMRWFALLLVTLGALAVTLLIVHNAPAAGAAGATARQWLWIIAGYFVIVVPAAFFRTNWIFRGYYRYHPVAPSKYLKGVTIVWVALAVGAWMSLAVCVFTRTLLPNILFAGVGNVMLLALWPKGNAMSPPAGNPADPGQYQEPR
jgi:hypothetical protein